MTTVGWRLRVMLIGLAAGLLAGCAPLERVVLLPQASNPRSAVEVSSPRGQLLLDKPYQVAEVSSDGAVKLAVTTEAEVKTRFGRLLELQPAAERRQLLYFAAGGARLTPESEQLVPVLVRDALARPGGEIVVIGHTDTTGAVEANDALSLQRAQAVRQLLVQAGLKPEAVEAIGRGKRELLVPTADQVDEPRNRRVEVIVR